MRLASANGGLAEACAIRAHADEGFVAADGRSRELHEAAHDEAHRGHPLSLAEEDGAPLIDSTFASAARRCRVASSTSAKNGNSRSGGGSDMRRLCFFPFRRRRVAERPLRISSLRLQTHD